MVTTRAPQAQPIIIGVEQTNATGYRRALALGMRHDAAVLAAEHPEYLEYFTFVHPMDFRVAFASKDGLHKVLTRLGYDVGTIVEPVRVVKNAETEDIRPKMNF